ncbi:exo-alpha-sialidase [Mangrovibacterium lignilyticum]|uniref:exo-alpha-sialidase n=1 Tax=Mangrovibacterium lignilyticum TaxID=2668052 RepID=UPI0019685EC3|nr:exo-alpha-sialidase [Mangrovibacterium lignilyticum]
MNLGKKLINLFFLVTAVTGLSQAQELPSYTGKTLNNPDYHHGQLAPVLGVHNIETFRANREFPEMADGLGWTYNHAPMIAYWNNTFFLEYLSDPVGEHIAPGATLIQTSKEGSEWTKPEVIFPAYDIPDGFSKEGDTAVARNLQSVNHQRMGFYVSSNNKLLVLAYMAISLNEKDSPNDGNGIGRVVREIKADGSWGPIYFIRYNHNWNEKNTTLPFYKKSKEKAFVKACDELLANRLMVQQWNEEADRDDPLISLKGEYKAFNFYHLADGKVVGLWKHALTAISEDEGKTWTKPTRAPGFVNSNAKIWGQRTSDGHYATVYNPSDFRWPLAVSTSDDGLNYTNLLLVNGEISPMRYGGNYKSYGPQYVRGIAEGNGTPNGGNMWVTYSMNKEDIWVSKVPVPVVDKETSDVNDVFNQMPEGKELDRWNIFSPVWARVAIEKDASGTRCLVLNDQDKSDYAKAERLFPRTANVSVEFKIAAAQNDHGQLDVELVDEKGTAALRLSFNGEGQLQQKNGYRMKNILSYEDGKEYDIKIELTAGNRFYHVFVNGEKKSTGLCFAPVHAVERVTFRTGDVRRFPDVDTPTDQDYDLKETGKPAPLARFSIYSLTTKDL